ncbi:MAG TPA: TRAP transporter large permease subunit, partial [Guyparkeria sp.]|nr:TRAP transporter large permease subunit [Guyparkeria sp.]
MAHRAADDRDDTARVDGKEGGSTEALRIAESEQGARKPRRRWQRWLLILTAVGWSLFQLYATYFGSLSPQKLGAIHLAFGFSLAFLSYPGKRGPSERIPWHDWLLAGVGVVTALYIVVNYYNLVAVQGGLPIPRDVWMGTLLLITLGIAAARVVGIALPIIAGVVILYGITGPAGIIPLTPPDVLFLHNGYDWPQIIQQLYITTEGIWGTPIQVSASFVFLFVLFGALLDRAGGGNWFIKVAIALLGALRGGPAKAAVLSSMLTGMISGSSIANTVTTGTFTIPLMRRIGFPAEKAGAVEVASST